MKMEKTLFLAAILITSPATPVHAGFLDKLMDSPIFSPQKTATDNETIVSALKEALSIGTENAVGSVSRLDGYFANEIIRILMPPEIGKVAKVLRSAGFGYKVDEFELSMNRAAERAAPEAAAIFIGAIKEMSFEDAVKILDGDDTAATDYFRSKTSGSIHNAFGPIVSSAMNEVGVTRYYKGMVDAYSSIPFTGSVLIDLDKYVTDRSIDGLFYMVGEEERKIRTDPAARVTDLLKSVFGK
ncbi:MAG: DUF4197 domain-containing protein [Thermodesulfobacteriota bacterium]